YIYLFVAPRKEFADEEEDHSELIDTSSKKSLRIKNNEVQPMGKSFADMSGSRDPNNLNSHCQVEFDDIIGEPGEPLTPEFCWNCSRKCYTYTQRFLYIILVVIFSPFIAFFTGCAFACVAFQQIWCIGPCLRCWKINLATVRNFWWGFLLACCGPCAEVLGLYFSKIKVRYQKLPDSDSNDESVAAGYFNI
ncbi:Caveolin-2, partial [Armadillidium vulgare]